MRLRYLPCSTAGRSATDFEVPPVAPVRRRPQVADAVRARRCQAMPERVSASMLRRPHSHPCGPGYRCQCHHQRGRCGCIRPRRCRTLSACIRIHAASSALVFARASISMPCHHQRRRCGCIRLRRCRAISACIRIRAVWSAFAFMRKSTPMSAPSPARMRGCIRIDGRWKDAHPQVDAHADTNPGRLCPLAACIRSRALPSSSADIQASPSSRR